MVGGLLVAVAALGTWYVASGADDGPETSYVTASRALAPGERITRSDVALVSIDLPNEVSGGAFTSVDEVIDTVSLGPIGSGELIQAGAVAPVAPANLAELSFSVEVDWAVGGDLRPGDLIDLFDTPDRAGATQSERVLTAATILDLSRPDDGLGRNRTITITLGVDPADLPAAVRATRTGTISVVRVTGAAATSPSETGAGDGTDDGTDGGARDETAADEDDGEAEGDDEAES